MSLRSLFRSRLKTRDVSVHEVASRKAGVRVIDVREPSEFNGDFGHIEGAELVPLATVERAAGKWPPDDEIIVVCGSGGRSARAAQSLSKLGFQGISNMAGGMMAWNAAGLPVERSR